MSGNKIHLDHPTQATACGQDASTVSLFLSAVKFRQIHTALQCRRCLRTLRAADAGRKHYRGIEPAARDAGAPTEKDTPAAETKAPR